MKIRSDSGLAGKVLLATKVLEEIDSPQNGKIRVIRSLALGTYIQADNLTQSGGLLNDVWRKPLRKLLKKKFSPSTVLVLGLGGGTVVNIIKKFWPKAEITAIDNDPIMVELGKKYLGFVEAQTKIVISDAYEFLKDHKKGKKYDLVVVDLYVGDKYPDKFENEGFISLVKKLLVSNGTAVFNRLYYGDKRSLAVKFCNRLEKMFSKVEVIYPEANIMFICTR